MDISALLWHPLVRWTINVVVHAIILLLCARLAARAIRWASSRVHRLKLSRALFTLVASVRQRIRASHAGQPNRGRSAVTPISTPKGRMNVKREYFTVIIPLLIATLIIVLALLVVPTQLENGWGVEPGVTPEESDNSSAVVKHVLPPAEERNTLPVSHVLVATAVIIGLAPYGFDVYRQKRKRIRYEQDFSRFLFELAELLRGGLDPVAGVIELASSSTPEVYKRMESLAPQIDLLAKQLQWGMTFEEGMYDLAKRLKSELIAKYSDLVVRASRIGGQIGEVILQCSDDMEKTFMLEREKDAELREYITIIYIAQFTLVGLLVLLLKLVIPALQALSFEATGGGLAGLGFSIRPVKINFPQSFFHLIMINGFASGIIGGVMSEGDALQGLKHTVILMAASLIVCLLFFL